MHIDDRLATVLAVSATGDNQIRVQFRQLVDLVGTMPAGSRGPAVDQAMLRLGELAALIPAPERAAALTLSGVRLRNPRLVAELCCDHPAVAAAVIASARLSDEQWLDLIPALPGPARDLLLQRDDLGAELRLRLVAQARLHYTRPDIQEALFHQRGVLQTSPKESEQHASMPRVQRGECLCIARRVGQHQCLIGARVGVIGTGDVGFRNAGYRLQCDAHAQAPGRRRDGATG